MTDCYIDGEPYMIYYGIDENGETIEILKHVDTTVDYDEDSYPRIY